MSDLQKENEKLRAELEQAQKDLAVAHAYNEGCRQSLRVTQQEAARLMALIEAAPHSGDCSKTPIGGFGGPCGCFKSRVHTALSPQPSQPSQPKQA